MSANKVQIKNKAAEEKRHWVRLTNTCNQRCVFCHDRRNQQGGVVPFEEIVRDLQKGRRRGCRRVVLSGGEPTLHPELARVISEARRLGYSHVQMVSNGRMLFYKDFVKALKTAGLDEVTLSLHSHLEGPFEQITRAKGSFRQAMKGLLAVLENDFIVSVDIVINKLNYKSLARTMKFFIGLGVYEFDLLHLIPFGDAWQNRRDVYCPIQKAKKYLDEAFELSRKEQVYLWTNRLPAMYLEGYEDLIQSPRKLFDEVAGMEQELKNVLETGRPMICSGERCGYCFMEAFCQDLMRLRKDKFLSARQPPPCLKKKQQLKPAVYRFRKGMSLYRFLDFFIEHRYYVKSLRCGQCRFNRQCDGAHIEEIRTKGFKALVPFKK